MTIWPRRAFARRSGACSPRFAALTLALGLGTSACHVGIVRQVKGGDFQGAVDRVESSRFEARGKRARAYARALAELGKFEAARAALLRDFRRGQEMPSLVALADLEREAGRVGMAALHYARVFSLDEAALRGRRDVCRLFTERARAFLNADEPIAADQDLRRAYELCGAPEGAAQRGADLSLAGKIRPRASQRARDLRSLGSDSSDTSAAAAKSVSEQSQELERARLDARAKGPEALAEFARLWGVALPTAELAFVLFAEFEDLTQSELLSESDLRGLLGEAGPGELLALEAHLPPARGAWLRLRLRPFLSTRADASTQPSLTELVAKATAPELEASADVLASRAYKSLVLARDFDAAELIIHAWISRQLRSEEMAVASAAGLAADANSEAELQAQQVETARGPKWSRVALSAESRALLIAYARLKRARERNVEALKIIRRALSASTGPRDLSAAQLDRLRWREVRALLVAGAPWQAKAVILGSGPGDPTQPPVSSNQQVSALLAGIETQLAVVAALCPKAGAKCQSAQDRNVVERAFGHGWSGFETQARAGVGVAAPRSSGCAIPATWLFEDAGHVISQLARGEGEPLSSAERAADLLASVESSLTLGCEAYLAVELMVEGLHPFGVETLSTRLSHSTVQRASSTLELVSSVALATGDAERSVRTTIAAAAESAHPQDVWRRAARRAWRVGLRDVELEAWTRVLEWAPQLDDPQATRGLLRIGLDDARRDHTLREGEAIRIEAYAHLFDAHLAKFPREQRAAQARRVRADLEQQWRMPGREADARAHELLDALVPAPASMQEGVQILGPSTGSPGAKGDEAQGIRIGRIVVGSPRERIAALVDLMAQLAPDRPAQLRVVEVLSHRAAALERDAEQAAPLLPDSELAARLLFALPIDLARFEP